MSTAQHQVSYDALYQVNAISVNSNSNFISFSRADKTLQDIVYKLVPGLFKGKAMFPEALTSHYFPCYDAFLPQWRLILFLTFCTQMR